MGFFLNCQYIAYRRADLQHQKANGLARVSDRSKYDGNIFSIVACVSLFNLLEWGILPLLKISMLSMVHVHAAASVVTASCPRLTTTRSRGLSKPGCVSGDVSE